MASIKERINKNGKKSFYVRIRRKGLLECQTFPTITKAREYIQSTESAMREGRYAYHIEAKKHTLGETIDRYIQDVLPNKPKSYRKQRAQLIWWKCKIGHLLLFDITPPRIAEQRDALLRQVLSKGQKRSSSTTNRYLAAISHVFSIAIKDWGWATDNPVQKISKPKEVAGRSRVLSKHERDRLLAACLQSSNKCLYPVVVLALTTGMRQAEILSLKWEDVNFEHKRVVLSDSKNGEKRGVVLAATSLDILKKLHGGKNHISPYVFPSSRSEYEPASIRHAWEDAVQVARIDDFRFHDLRHCFATEMAAQGVSPVQLRFLMGHKSFSMTARYTHVEEERMREDVEKMARKVFGETG
jgi:integrase